MIEVMDSDYMLFARAGGERGFRLFWRHGLRNILLPAITLQAASIGELIGGSVLVEQVFSYPGLGQEILTFAETYARNAGKEVLRLDSQKVNDDLSRYYEALGYPAVGECVDGAYVGIKREKPLNG